MLEIKQGKKYNPYYIEKLGLTLNSFLNIQESNKVIEAILNSNDLIVDENFYFRQVGVNFQIFI